ncbi:MAG: hypothetical protein ACXWC0_26430, partial [Burkholderiales bacterium]
VCLDRTDSAPVYRSCFDKLSTNSTAVIARSSVTKHPTAPLPVANEKPWATKDGIASAAWQSPRRPCGRFAMTVCLVL